MCPMNVLFITSSRIGDAVLSTGLLDHIARTYPAARVTVVCGPLCVSLFEGYPLLDQIIPLKKAKYNKHWFALWRVVSRQKWDMIVDLRNSMVSRLVPAKHKFVFGSRIDQKLHKVEQNALVMKLDYVAAPKLWFTDEQKSVARNLLPKGSKIIAIGPTANWRAKTWPAENFIEIAKFLREEIFPEARFAVFAAKGEEKDAYDVLQTIPKDKQIDVIAKVDPGTIAAALSYCEFYIGNDSGLMHMASAVQTKTLGLFGPSWPHLYRPWSETSEFISTPETFDELTSYEGYTAKTAPCLMGSLSVDAVKTKIRQMFSR